MRRAPYRPRKSCQRPGGRKLQFQKSLHASEQDWPDVGRRREPWKKHQCKLDRARLVFIDETWAKTNMTRTHGRCARGRRLNARVRHRRWRTLSINAKSFAYVEQVLLPTLAPGGIVIMDNLG